MLKPYSLARAIADADKAQQPRNVAAQARITFSTLPPSKNRTKQPIPWRDTQTGRLSARMSNTAVYETWIRNTKREIMLVQRPPMVLGDVVVVVSVARHGRLDLPNMVDATCDMLQTARVLQNDKQIVDLRFLWAELPDGVGAVCEVRRV